MARPLKRSEIEEFIDWTRVGPDELVLMEQLDGATHGDYDKILRELARRGVFSIPDDTGAGEATVALAIGGDPAALVKSLFGRFFTE